MHSANKTPETHSRSFMNYDRILGFSVRFVNKRLWVQRWLGQGQLFHFPVTHVIHTIPFYNIKCIASNSPSAYASALSFISHQWFLHCRIYSSSKTPEVWIFSPKAMSCRNRAFAPGVFSIINSSIRSFHITCATLWAWRWMPTGTHETHVTGGVTGLCKYCPNATNHGLVPETHQPIIYLRIDSNLHLKCICSRWNYGF